MNQKFSLNGANRCNCYYGNIGGYLSARLSQYVEKARRLVTGKRSTQSLRRKLANVESPLGKSVVL